MSIFKISTLAPLLLLLPLLLAGQSRSVRQPRTDGVYVFHFSDESVATTEMLRFYPDQTVIQEEVDRSVYRSVGPLLNRELISAASWEILSGGQVVFRIPHHIDTFELQYSCQVHKNKLVVDMLTLNQGGEILGASRQLIYHFEQLPGMEKGTN